MVGRSPLGLEGAAPDVVGRAKAKLADGGGLRETLAHYADERISDADYAREHVAGRSLKLRSKEELYYCWLFHEVYPGQDVIRLMGRSWSV
jgi:hypothetical protein